MNVWSHPLPPLVHQFRLWYPVHWWFFYKFALVSNVSPGQQVCFNVPNIVSFFENEILQSYHDQDRGPWRVGFEVSVCILLYPAFFNLQARTPPGNRKKCPALVPADPYPDIAAAGSFDALLIHSLHAVIVVNAGTSQLLSRASLVKSLACRQNALQRTIVKPAAVKLAKSNHGWQHHA